MLSVNLRNRGVPEGSSQNSGLEPVMRQAEVGNMLTVPEN